MRWEWNVWWVWDWNSFSMGDPSIDRSIDHRLIRWNVGSTYVLSDIFHWISMVAERPNMIAVAHPTRQRGSESDIDRRLSRLFANRIALLTLTGSRCDAMRCQDRRQSAHIRSGVEWQRNQGSFQLASSWRSTCAVSPTLSFCSPRGLMTHLNNIYLLKQAKPED